MFDDIKFFKTRFFTKLFDKVRFESNCLEVGCAMIREVVAYARDRGIRVVPEFDMPGHSSSWFVGYPQYASGRGPYQIQRTWGVFDPAFDPTRESVYAFINGFIGEMAGLF